VQSLPSGLQYKVLTAGTGATPKASDTVQTHYSGKLLDGTVFDSSYDRGQPAVFGVDQVIAGWTEALQKMKVGDKWEVYIPGDLAYGLRGSPPKIGPNALLIFTVELINVEPSLPAPNQN
jgi:FKBP-type peptidyl-prolyl cis-trans isomerase